MCRTNVTTLPQAFFGTGDGVEINSSPGGPWYAWQIDTFQRSAIAPRSQLLSEIRRNLFLEDLRCLRLRRPTLRAGWLPRTKIWVSLPCLLIDEANQMTGGGFRLAGLPPAPPSASLFSPGSDSEPYKANFQLLMLLDQSCTYGATVHPIAFV